MLQQVSRRLAAYRVGYDAVSRRERRRRPEIGCYGDRASRQRRAGHGVHAVAQQQRRQLQPGLHVQIGNRHQHCRGRYPKPGAASDAVPSGGSPDARRDRHQEVARHADDDLDLFAGHQLVVRPLSDQLRDDQHHGPALADRRSGQRQTADRTYAMRIRFARTSKLDQSTGISHAIQRRTKQLSGAISYRIRQARFSAFHGQRSRWHRRQDQFDNIIIKTNPDGSILRLRDVARTELGSQVSAFQREWSRPAALSFLLAVAGLPNASTWRACAR